jgi:hypothetical protein
MPNTENITIEVENNVVRIIEDIPKPDPRIIEKTLDELYVQKTDLLNQKDALISECDYQKDKLQATLNENIAFIDKDLGVIQKAIDDGINQGATISN